MRFFMSDRYWHSVSIENRAINDRFGVWFQRVNAT